MGGKKKYDGYRAYDYLDPGIDFKPFNLRKAIADRWSYTVPLSPTEEDRAKDIINKSIIIDLHEHPCIYPVDISQSPLLNRQGRQFTAYHALSLSGLDGVFDNLMNGESSIATKHGWDWMSTIHDLGMRLCDIAHQNFITPARTVDDVVNAHRDGKLAWIAVLESASCIENEVDRIDILYGLGVRSMGICYSESNMLGSGLKEAHDGGLTDFGYDAVVRMNKLGMLIDVSHTSDQTALDTIESSRVPIVISHCGARALTPISRMFPDEVLHALAENGGVFGVEAAPNMTVTARHPKHSIESYMEHIEYCIELMGIDYVGCGPDTMYGDHVNLYRAGASRSQTEGLGQYSRDESAKGQFLGIEMDVDSLPEYVRGMENPTECLQNVVRWMVKHGYSDLEIQKVVGQNALRLLRESW
ncbi:MAG: membrane dipeptidase [Candidatus Bathyarchaeota archaeon]|nr:MAG: membrane dipeptidase [Candidatus Bathyarchaeota archaeon]